MYVVGQLLWYWEALWQGGAAKCLLMGGLGESGGLSAACLLALSRPLLLNLPLPYSFPQASRRLLLWRPVMDMYQCTPPLPLPTQCTHSPPAPPPCPQASDVYSFGVILWEMFHSKPPYKRSGRQGFVLRRGFPFFPDTAPLRFAQLATACMAQTPRSRPSFSQISSEILGILSAGPEVRMPPMISQITIAQPRPGSEGGAPRSGNPPIGAPPLQQQHGVGEGGAPTAAAACFPGEPLPPAWVGHGGLVRGAEGAVPSSAAAVGGVEAAGGAALPGTPPPSGNSGGAASAAQMAGAAAAGAAAGVAGVGAGAGAGGTSDNGQALPLVTDEYYRLQQERLRDFEAHMEQQRLQLQALQAQQQQLLQLQLLQAQQQAAVAAAVAGAWQQPDEPAAMPPQPQQQQRSSGEGDADADGVSGGGTGSGGETPTANPVEGAPRPASRKSDISRKSDVSTGSAMAEASPEFLVPIELRRGKFLTASRRPSMVQEDSGSHAAAALAAAASGTSGRLPVLLASAGMGAGVGFGIETDGRQLHSNPGRLMTVQSSIATSASGGASGGAAVQSRITSAPLLGAVGSGGSAAVAAAAAYQQQLMQQARLSGSASAASGGLGLLRGLVPSRSADAADIGTGRESLELPVASAISARPAGSSPGYSPGVPPAGSSVTGGVTGVTVRHPGSVTDSGSEEEDDYGSSGEYSYVYTGSHYGLHQGAGGMNGGEIWDESSSLERGDSLESAGGLFGEAGVQSAHAPRI